MAPSALQRLPSRLAPLSEVLARIDAMARPVETREVDVAAATPEPGEDEAHGLDLTVKTFLREVIA